MNIKTADFSRGYNPRYFKIEGCSDRHLDNLKI